MKRETIKEKLDTLWGAIIVDTHFNLMNHEVGFELEIVENGRKDLVSIKFIDISSYYFVNEEEESRYDFYDRENVDYLELTTISFLDKNKGELGDIKFSLPLEQEWSKGYHSQINIVMEIWNSILCLDARKIVINQQAFSLK